MKFHLDPVHTLGSNWNNALKYEKRAISPPLLVLWRRQTSNDARRYPFE